MYPELFKLPFTELTVKSYGLMMVIGFVLAIYLIRYLARDISISPDHITNAAFYALLAGLAGARIFYVIHYFDQFRGNLLSIFAIHKGGLEFLGGVVLAFVVIVFYLYRHKLAVRRYLDVLVIGLILALVFGRLGCFMNGCCFGKVSSLPWAVRFPYNSLAYQSQVNPNPQRNRLEPQLQLPYEFFGYVKKNDGLWYRQLKSFESLTEPQRQLVTTGPYRSLPVHPTQFYSALNAFILCFVLYLFWRHSCRRRAAGKPKSVWSKPGSTFALMFILYGITRFLLEFIRDDNPFEFDSLTVSQNISIAIVIIGAALMIIFAKIKDEPAKGPEKTVGPGR
jgi:phosphatidylglycerol:prolipoprotein diacylglycerol transferase